VQYQVLHTIEYTYDRAVRLTPHDLRLQPRTDGFQTLQSFQLQVRPSPLGQTTVIDALGNLVTRCWWAPETKIDRLTIQASSTTQTHYSNPFDYLLEPWATHLPVDYPRSQSILLSPYFPQPYFDLSPSWSTIEWAQDLASQCQSQVSEFLLQLNQTIYQNCTYCVRERGAPWPAHVTWQRKQGSCRDLVVLFMAACEAVGLASRFVSGYEQGAPEQEQTLHAWAEVYLPGAGWRGYDPTMGLVVSDRHIALAACRLATLTNPVTGGYQEQASCQLYHQVLLQAI
jgi:transglutaminase-like putative cysteine protease